MRVPSIPYQHVKRTYHQNRRLVNYSAIIIGLVAPYLIAWLLVRHEHAGRWFWNWWVSFHPIMASIVPNGRFEQCTSSPRWIQEIHEAPWMGDWEIPTLTKPTYVNDPSTEARTVISPALIKLHVFSMVSEKARLKRHQIRRLSPLLSIPESLRHLVELKFVMGHAYKEDWVVDQEMEDLLAEEQRQYGDLIRLNLAHGENLREGKILDWIRAAGTGDDGGRPGWYLFKMDDDTVVNMPVFLDSLIALDPKTPTYLGTSLNRWPPFQHHFTGMLTGFSWGLVETLASGIGKMSRQDIETWYDDDVLTGELMFDLPSAPHCQVSDSTPLSSLPAYCDPHEPPPWGYAPPPPAHDPRTGLYRYDYLRRMGDPARIIVKGDVAMHSWFFKQPGPYEKEWNRKSKGKMWNPPQWVWDLAEDS